MRPWRTSFNSPKHQLFKSIYDAIKNHVKGNLQIAVWKSEIQTFRKCLFNFVAVLYALPFTNQKVIYHQVWNHLQSKYSHHFDFVQFSGFEISPPKTARVIALHQIMLLHSLTLSSCIHQYTHSYCNHFYNNINILSTYRIKDNFIYTVERDELRDVKILQHEKRILFQLHVFHPLQYLLS